MSLARAVAVLVCLQHVEERKKKKKKLQKNVAHFPELKVPLAFSQY